MLTCFNLSSERGYRTLFSGLGFTLFPGALVGVFGANGSGKTTLLRMVAGLMPPKTGTITLEDIPLKEHPSYPRVINYVGHRNALFLDMTVAENILYWARMRDEEGMVEPALKHFGLIPYADYPCRNLSAGWQRKVALSRLLVTQSPIWILDEPFNNLDEEGCYRLGTAISTRINNKGAVLLAGHNSSIMKFNILLNINDYN
jgi:heme exporter protein A